MRISLSLASAVLLGLFGILFVFRSEAPPQPPPVKPEKPIQEPEKATEIERAGTEGAGHAPEAVKRVKPSRAAERDALFAGPAIQVAITIGNGEIAALEADPRSYVLCTVRSGGRVYQRVGIHLKGAAGSFRPIHDRPGLTLNFKKFPPGRLFHGLKKIHLNNSVQDPSYLTDILCSDLFIASGVPAARGTHARVELNGRDLGLYLLVEGMDDAFLTHHYGGNQGNLYDGGFLKDLTGGPQRVSGREADYQAGVRALVSAAREGDPEVRWSRLEAALDLERFLTFMAIEVFTWDWDGYVMKRNNYRLYHDPGTGRITFMPHAMDQMYHSPNGPIIPNVEGLVAQAILRLPRGRALYLKRLEEVAAAFQLPQVRKRIQELEQRIREAMADRQDFISVHRRACQDVRNRIEARLRSVLDQLASLPQPLAFDTQGVAGLTGWRPRAGGVAAALEETTSDDGLRVLRIAGAARGNSAPSFRLKVPLPEGQYVFQGRARVSDVVPLGDKKGSGAGLRISRTQAPRLNQLDGDTGWTDLRYEFEVSGGLQDVELVCELRALRGEALFDLRSLSLTRAR